MRRSLLILAAAALTGCGVFEVDMSCSLVIFEERLPGGGTKKIRKTLSSPTEAYDFVRDYRPIGEIYWFSVADRYPCPDREAEDGN
jgi:hypothetical protein